MKEIQLDAEKLDALLLTVLCALDDQQAIKERGHKAQIPFRDANKALRGVQDLRREIAATFPKRPKTKMRYQMYLESVGNPDHGQYAPVSEPVWVAGETLIDMRKHVRGYMGEWNLGGGNWVDPVVLEGKKEIGRFSYNGRFWSMEKSIANPHGTPIEIEEIK